MTPKPPEGFTTWLDVMEHAVPHIHFSMTWPQVQLARAELAALRARVAELEQQVADARTESAALLAAVREIEAGMSCELVTIGAYCERFGDKPIVVHPDRLDGIWRAIKARAECAMKWAAGALDLRARCEQLEQQVTALADALESLRNEDNCWCDGPEKDRRGETDITTHYIYCSEIRDALRATGRKT